MKTCVPCVSRIVHAALLVLLYPLFYVHEAQNNIKNMLLQWRHNELDSVSNHRRLDGLLNRLFRRWSKKTSKLRLTGLCEGNSSGTGEFPSERASNAENVSIWLRHHANNFCIALYISSCKGLQASTGLLHFLDRDMPWIAPWVFIPMKLLVRLRNPLSLALMPLLKKRS